MTFSKNALKSLFFFIKKKTKIKYLNLIFRFSIGNSDLINGLEYGWLYTLARITKQPYTQLIIFEEDNRTIAKIELKDGPPRKTMYVTALYYTMTCMTSVGFGNIAAETDNEKIFSICMMIVAGEYQCCQLRLIFFLLKISSVRSFALRHHFWSRDDHNSTNDLSYCPIPRYFE